MSKLHQNENLQFYILWTNTLLKYGRPIIGDTYYKLKDVPVTTKGLDILRGHSNLATAALLKEAVEIHGRVCKTRGTRSLVFQVRIKVLNQIKETLGAMSAYDLRDLSHKEHAYIASRCTKR